jgi:hypothetical protein
MSEDCFISHPRLAAIASYSHSRECFWNLSLAPVLTIYLAYRQIPSSLRCLPVLLSGQTAAEQLSHLGHSVGVMLFMVFSQFFLLLLLVGESVAGGYE